MPKAKFGRVKHRGNVTRFTKGIKGQVLECIEITNERESMTISLEFEDKIDMTMTLHWSDGLRRAVRRSYRRL